MNNCETSTRLDTPVTDWLRRIAVTTGAFRILEIIAEPGPSVASEWHPDFAVKIQPKGQHKPFTLLVEFKQRITPAIAWSTLARMQTVKDKTPRIMCSFAISERVAEMCQERGIGYLDEAGNCRIFGPGLFLQIQGHRNTRPDTRPAVDLFAPKSSRLLRVLMTHPNRGWQVQALAAEANVSIGLASRIKSALLEQSFVEERMGLIFLSHPAELLREWSKNAPLRSTKRLELFSLDKPPIAEQRIADWCQRHSIRCALTQFSGAWRLAPMVRYNRASIYVEANPQILMDEMHLKPVNSGSNLSIWIPDDPFVFYDMRQSNGINVISPVQLYLDLINDPGRGEDAAVEILEKTIKPTW